MKTTLKAVAHVGLVAMFVLTFVALAEACPNCKDAISGDPAQQGLAKGLYYSILFMMSMPFFIFGSLSAYFYYLVRCDQHAKARQASSLPGEPRLLPGELPPRELEHGDLTAGNFAATTN